MRVIPLLLLTSLSLLSTHVMADASLRERRVVTVGGEKEEWLLKWSGPVKPVCPATKLTQAMTCPCVGFAYGEQGRLVLERKRAGVPVESLNLSSLFGEYDTPADPGNAALARIPRHPHDPFDDLGDPEMARKFAADLDKRPPIDVMNVMDFSQDGTRAAFLLQVGTEPCGKREMALIGVSRRLPRLHAFVSTAHPERPLLLQDRAWTALLAKGGHAKFTDLTCGDHGSESEVEQIIDAHDGLLSVRANTYACHEDGSRGAVIRSEEQ